MVSTHAPFYGFILLFCPLTCSRPSYAFLFGLTQHPLALISLRPTNCFGLLAVSPSPNRQLAGFLFLCLTVTPATRVLLRLFRRGICCYLSLLTFYSADPQVASNRCSFQRNAAMMPTMLTNSSLPSVIMTTVF